MVGSHLVLHTRGEDESVDEALALESVEPPHLGGVRVRVRLGSGVGLGLGLGLALGLGLGFELSRRTCLGIGLGIGLGVVTTAHREQHH